MSLLADYNLPFAVALVLMALLGLVQVAIEMVVYGVVALSVTLASTWFRRSVVRRRLEALTGTVLLALGVRLALSDR